MILVTFTVITVFLWLLWLWKYNEYRKKPVTKNTALGVKTFAPTLFLMTSMLFIFFFMEFNQIHLLYLYPLVLIIGQIIIASFVVKSDKGFQDPMLKQ